MNIPTDRIIEFVTNHRLLFLALLIVTVLLIRELLESAFRRYKELTPIKAVPVLNDEDATVINVSEPPDFARGYIEHSIHIPLSKLNDRLYELEKLKDRPLIVTCWTGMHSAQACRKLAKLGFHRLFHLKGGVQAWDDDKLPITGKKK